MKALKTGIKKAAKEVVEEAMGGKEENRGSRAPEDPEAYAKKVADAIKADIRCVNAGLFVPPVYICVCLSCC